MTVGLAYFLIHRSRTAWLFTLFAVSAQVVSVLVENQSGVLLVAPVLLLFCLISPRSVRAVWVRPKGVSITRRVKTLENAIGSAEFFGVTKVQGILAMLARIGARLEVPGVLRKYVFYSVVSFLLLAPAVGVLYELHVGAAKGNVALDIVWFFVWISYNLLRIAVVCLLIVAVHRWLAKDRVAKGRGQALD
jgi:hypothetical protein